MSTDILERVFLTHAPIYEASGAIIGTRLTVLPRSGTTAVPATELLQRIVESLGSLPKKSIWLNALDEDLVRGLLTTPMQPDCVVVEVPAFMLAEPDIDSAIVRRHARGGHTAIKGGAKLTEIQGDLKNRLCAAVVDIDVERCLGRLLPNVPSVGLPQIHADVASLADVRASFAAGARAVMGWPVDGPARIDPLGHLMTSLKRLCRFARHDQSAALMQATAPGGLLASWCQDPHAERLLRCIDAAMEARAQRFPGNTAQYGLQSSISRWVPVLAATCTDREVKMLSQAAKSRAFMMKYLVGPNWRQSNEVYLCGALSLLDKVFNKPMASLLDLVPVPTAVRLALASDSGPYVDAYKLVQALEKGRRDDIERAAASAFLTARQVNLATLKALDANRRTAITPPVH